MKGLQEASMMFDHDQHLFQSGLLKTSFWDNYYRFQTKAGKSAETRILMLLEFFRELYHRRGEIFRKMVPDDGLHEEFVELFKRISSSLLNTAKSKREERTLQRSLSAGSELKLDRFKVKTVSVGGQGDKTKVAETK
ncbi:hypothetical protein RIF29_21127 [Crotalaria pallida]|uniref:Uncharacterized protein n=1 Tax=Crotalaria pallida TaxID=3830 RepID=A0AAN9F467_CROPI